MSKHTIMPTIGDLTGTAGTASRLPSLAVRRAAGGLELKRGELDLAVQPGCVPGVSRTAAIVAFAWRVWVAVAQKSVTDAAPVIPSRVKRLGRHR